MRIYWLILKSAPTLAKFGGARALVNVPLLKDDELIGSIVIFRQEAGPFGDKQIELVKNFAAQAVIAIENTRLLNELRQRTDDLSEALEQQTATSEVLAAISSSPGELEPVFRAMLENAVRICEAKFGVLNLHENGALRMGAMHNVPSAFADFLQQGRGAYKPTPGSLLDRVMRTKEVGHIADNAAEAAGRAATLGGARSIICVPMLKENELIGTISIYRQEVRPFTEKQIKLLTNFAAQAVIAIENTRLLNELRESLEQQTATSEVLQVISSSPGELEPCSRRCWRTQPAICEAKFGSCCFVTATSSAESRDTIAARRLRNSMNRRELVNSTCPDCPPGSPRAEPDRWSILPISRRNELPDEPIVRHHGGGSHVCSSCRCSRKTS